MMYLPHGANVQALACGHYLAKNRLAKPPVRLNFFPT
jgi:hypothetical protein